jgi:ribosomal protein L7/L12
MKIEARMETCDYLITLTLDEAKKLYEALLLAKRNGWQKGSCEDINVEIEDDGY